MARRAVGRVVEVRVGGELELVEFVVPQDAPRLFVVSLGGNVLPTLIELVELGLLDALALAANLIGWRGLLLRAVGSRESGRGIHDHQRRSRGEKCPGQPSFVKVI